MLVLDFLNQIVEMVTMYWEAFAALGGLAALLPAIINVLKKLGVVGEGEADGWQAMINAFLFVIFVGLRIFLPNLDVGVVDSVLFQIAAVITAILSFFGQFAISRLAYKKVWKGRLGAFGFYHS
jgi:hypothetical protein